MIVILYIFVPTQTTAPMGISESVFSMGGLQEKVEDIQKDISEDPFKNDSDPFKSKKNNKLYIVCYFF